MTRIENKGKQSSKISRQTNPTFPLLTMDTLTSAITAYAARTHMLTAVTLCVILSKYTAQIAVHALAVELHAIMLCMFHGESTPRSHLRPSRLQDPTMPSTTSLASTSTAPSTSSSKIQSAAARCLAPALGRGQSGSQHGK